MCYGSYGKRGQHARTDGYCKAEMEILRKNQKDLGLGP